MRSQLAASAITGTSRVNEMLQLFTLFPPTRWRWGLSARPRSNRWIEALRDLVDDGGGVAGALEKALLLAQLDSVMSILALSDGGIFFETSSSKIERGRLHRRDIRAALLLDLLHDSVGVVMLLPNTSWVSRLRRSTRSAPSRLSL